MKKYFLIFSFTFISSFAFSQTKQVETITVKKPVATIKKSDLSGIKVFSDLEKTFPKENKIIDMEVTVHTKGKLNQFMSKGDQFFEEGIKGLQSADVGSNVYIIIRYMDVNSNTQKPVMHKYVYKAVQ